MKSDLEISNECKMEDIRKIYIDAFEGVVRDYID